MEEFEVLDFSAWWAHCSALETTKGFPPRWEDDLALQIIGGYMLGVAPPSNSDHQDYHIFSRGFL